MLVLFLQELTRGCKRECGVDVCCFPRVEDPSRECVGHEDWLSSTH